MKRTAGEPPFRTLVENLSDSILVCDGTGRFLSANPAACGNLGYTFEEMTALSLADIEVGVAGDEFERLWERLRNDGRTRIEGIHRRKDGSRFPVDVSLALFADHGAEWVIALARDITEFKAVEDALRERESNLAQAQAIAHLGHWVWTVADDIVRWSAEACRIFGRTETELGSAYEGFVNTLHPDDRERVMAAVGASVETGDPYDCRYRIVLPDGAIRHIHALAEMTRDPDTGAPTAMVGTVQDVTEHMEAVAALKESETRLRQVTENIRDVFWVDSLEKGTKMVYVSPAYEEIWGRSCESLYDDPISFVDAIHPDDRERVIAAFPGQRTGDYDEIYRVIRPDGALRWVHDRAFPIRNEQGEVYRVTGIASDITRLRELQENLSRAQRLEAVGTLAGGIAHDFNNLLAIIMTTAEAALHGTPQGDARHEMLTRILDTGRRGAGIVRNLLRFARKEGAIKEVLAPGALIDEVLTLVGSTFDRRICVERDIAPDLWRVEGDSSQIYQILMNLCVNARDAMPPERAGCLSVTARNVPDHHGVPHILIEVRDDGDGIPEAIQEKVFEPFFTTKPPGKGSGLGLATVYGIVENHGGEVSFESREGEGTVFRIFLPVAEGEPAGTGVTVAAVAGLAIPAQPILLAEDEPLLQLVISNYLQEKGCEVITVGNGRDAVDQISRHGMRLGVAIVDLMMPEVNGEEVLKVLKRDLPATPVIVMSGFGSREALDDMAWPAHYGFLHKPFSLAELSGELERVLG